jgi:hypothetical protein
VKNILGEASLLNCLWTVSDPSSTFEPKREAEKFRLIVKTVSENPEETEKYSYPFYSLSEQNDLARIISARLTTDAGSQIKDLILCIQRDEYGFKKDELWPINNIDIAEVWQKAFTRFRSHGAKSKDFVFFGDQCDSAVEFLQYQPLLFCKYKYQFFRPICPKCGQVLEQCGDDEILKKFGLASYSESLVRYLFCSGCYRRNAESDFYLKTLSPPHVSFVKDIGGLIDGYRDSLISDKNPALPCKHCVNLKECFDNSRSAKNRIVPFSFYPFFMMAFDAPAINASDFITLLSGAPPSEIRKMLLHRGEPGRAEAVRSVFEVSGKPVSFLFDVETKRFLEILYLKLSFLKDLVQSVSGDLDRLKFPDLNLSMDQIWISVDEPTGGLPNYWNFRVKVFDLGGGAFPTTCLPKLPPFFGLHYLGMVWFFTLLSNKRQSAAEIRRAIGGMLSEMEGGENTFDEMPLPELIRSVFSPVNIVWDPIPKPEPDMLQDTFCRDDLLEIWKKCLKLGVELLKISMGKDPEWLAGDFLERLEQVRKRVKEKLFWNGTGQIAEKNRFENDPYEDTAIDDILRRLGDRWEHEAGSDGGDEEADHEPHIVPEDLEGEKTILVRDPDASMSRKDLRFVQHGRFDDDSQETVVLNRERAEQMVTDMPRSFGETDQDTGVSKTPFPDSASRIEAQDDLSETVILGAPDQGQGRKPPELSRSAGTNEFSHLQKRDQEPIAGDEELEKTVVMGIDQKGDTGAKELETPKDSHFASEMNPPDDDFLSETVMIQSDGVNNRNPETAGISSESEKKPGKDRQTVEDEIDLEKTVVTSPDPFKGKRK